MVHEDRISDRHGETGWFGHTEEWRASHCRWEPSKGSLFKVWVVTEIRASPRRGEAADVRVGG
jgi:hypothetical protein